MPDSPDTSGRKTYPERKSCGFQIYPYTTYTCGRGVRVNVSRKRNSTAYEKDRDASGKF